MFFVKIRLSQQKVKFTNLQDRLQTLLPLLSANGELMNDEVSSEGYKVKLSDVYSFIQEQSMFVMSRINKLDDDDIHDL